MSAKYMFQSSRLMVATVDESSIYAISLVNADVVIFDKAADSLAAITHHGLHILKLERILGHPSHPTSRYSDPHSHCLLNIREELF